MQFSYQVRSVHVSWQTNVSDDGIGLQILRGFERFETACRASDPVTSICENHVEQFQDVIVIVNDENDRGNI